MNQGPDPVVLRCARHFARASKGDEPRCCNTTTSRASLGSERRGVGRASFEARAKTRERLRTTEQMLEFVLQKILNP
jgi:hypothetical protein